MAGAREEVLFLDEFRTAGFADARVVRITHNARSSNPHVAVAEATAVMPLGRASE